MAHASGERPPTSAKRAGLITIFGQLAKGVVQFIGLIVFSHLLSPHDVGLIAMLVVFIMLGELIRDFGITQAAIQTPKLTRQQASNLFWTSVAIGAVLTAILTAAAPLVAHMYGEPSLVAITPWIALSFTINSLQSQFQVILARNHRFAALTLTDGISQVIGLVAGVLAAVSNFGYWSLVIQTLTIYVALLLQRAIVARWWPCLPRHAAGMAQLYRFGIHSGLAQLLNYAALNADSYTIGIRWGAAALGTYNRAFQILTVPANQLLAPLTNVVLPLLSSKRHEGTDFYPLLWKVQVALSSTLTFGFAAAAALAEPLVHVVLGQSWLESAPLLAILSIGGAIQVLTFIGYWAFLASANTRPLFLQSLITKPLQVGCIFVGSFWGLRGVAWGFSIGLVISWCVCMAWLKHCDNMPIARFMRAGGYVLLCGVLAGGISRALAAEYLTQVSPIESLGIGIIAVAAIYFPSLMLSTAQRRVLIELVRPVQASRIVLAARHR